MKTCSSVASRKCASPMNVNITPTHLTQKTHEITRRLVRPLATTTVERFQLTLRVLRRCYALILREAVHWKFTGRCIFLSTTPINSINIKYSTPKTKSLGGWDYTHLFFISGTQKAIFSNRGGIASSFLGYLALTQRM